MVKAAAEGGGWIDERAIVLRNPALLQAAGADLILT